MALMSSQRSYSFKPPSFKTPNLKYDVFLSFRGEDVRDKFLEYLYRALCHKGIYCFKDDDKLKYGEKINNELLKAIEESNISVVVLSENYANSSWCLRELVHIIKCKRHNGPVVFPIFYHVIPSDVRKQEGAFGKGFAKACLKKEEEEVNKWRGALEEVSTLRGWHYPNTLFKTEAELIDNLVHEILDISNDRYRNPHEGLVGIRSRMMGVIDLLDLGSAETRVVGLWGMGGIGKTTLARVVYDHIFCRFEGCSFIDNVRDVFERSGVLPLQEQLISDILSENNCRVPSAIGRLGIIQELLRRKKVLIVLDDVSDTKQVEDLLPNLKQYRRESRIIITSRDKQVLQVYCAQAVLDVKKLDNVEAMQLFKSKAFAECGATGEFYGLIDRAIQYADGVPLALKVLGSLLLGGSKPKWESLLKRLGDGLDDELQKVLKISYDGLSWKDQQIFLDICCFFKGWDKDRVVNILDSCGFNAVYGIEELVQKSLLTISAYDKLLMHDLIEKMGRSIVNEESRNEPGERSRLWRPDDIKSVLKGNQGTNKIECIGCQGCPNLELHPDTFAKMPNLRILSLRTAHSSPKCSISLPNKLRFLFWNGYPFKYMPPSFQPEHLVELYLIGSCIERLWDRKTVLPELTVMNLSSSTSLTKSPDFSGFPNLKTLVLQGCNALVDIDPSIKDLKSLRILNLKDCKCLLELPELPPNVSDVLAYDCDSLRTICTPTTLRDARVLAFIGCPKLVGSEEINVLLGFKYLYDQIKENNHHISRVYGGPGSEIPEWIRYKAKGGLLEFPLSKEDLNTSKLVGFAFSAMVATKHRNCEIFWTTRIGGQVWELGPFNVPSSSENVMIYFLPIEKLIVDDLTHTSGSLLEVCLSTGGTENRWKPTSEVRACGVHLIYEDKVGPSGGKDELLSEVAANTYLKGT